MNEVFRQFLFLPEQGSSVAREVDTLHYFVITGTMLGALAVAVVAAIFLFRFRATVRPYSTTPKILVPGWLELLFVGGMLGLFVLWWHLGFRQFVMLRTPPPDSQEVYVTGKQWMWRFAYPDGRGSVGVLYIPAGRPIKAVLTSRDVIHSFYIPEFRIKQDAIPGRYTVVWFQAIRPGTYQLLCTEYCGTGHSTMRGEVVALSPDDYERWLDGDRRADGASAFPEYGKMTPLATTGAALAASKGCLRCHTTDGSRHIGPTWAGLFGSKVDLHGGGTAVADAAYLTDSMMDPRHQVVRGFEPVMPSYLGQLEPGEAAALVELIRSLREVEPQRPIAPAAIVPGGTPLPVPAPTPTTPGGAP
jgi:cytochrome c oxidase subunit II